MAILKKVKMICETCQGNGYVRVATGDTSKDFRDNSEVQQCWDCESEGEFYETVEVNNISSDANGSDSIH
jgi:DnaJ-class molecular chaperone|tara:strand:- start:378 stop:587 length:210 start_codon:yes stop_codon:yes gene_type:complete